MFGDLIRSKKLTSHLSCKEDYSNSCIEFWDIKFISRQFYILFWPIQKYTNLIKEERGRDRQSWRTKDSNLFYEYEAKRIRRVKATDRLAAAYRFSLLRGKTKSQRWSNARLMPGQWDANSRCIELGKNEKSWILSMPRYLVSIEQITYIQSSNCFRFYWPTTPQERLMLCIDAGLGTSLDDFPGFSRVDLAQVFNLYCQPLLQQNEILSGRRDGAPTTFSFIAGSIDDHIQNARLISGGGSNSGWMQTLALINRGTKFSSCMSSAERFPSLVCNPANLV